MARAGRGRAGPFHWGLWERVPRWLLRGLYEKARVKLGQEGASRVKSVEEHSRQRIQQNQGPGRGGAD